MASKKNGETTRQGGTYEMQWDCEYCGTGKLLGLTHRFCPNCGAAQNPDKRYFPAEKDKVAVKDHVYSGADKICPACSNPNGAKAGFCSQCGSPLSEAVSAKLHEDKPAAPKPAGNQTPSKKTGIKWLIITLAVLTGIAALLIFWTTEVALSVTGHSWEREIKIENYGPRSESAWCDQMPGDAYQVEKRREERSKRKIPDGETCRTERTDQGDGTYREVNKCVPKYRYEPVYDDRCYFSVDRWAYARSVKAEGKNKEPYWPKFSLKREGVCKGCERAGDKKEALFLHLEDSKNVKLYTCEVQNALWQSAQIKSHWQMEVGAITGGARCGSLQPLP